MHPMYPMYIVIDIIFLFRILLIKNIFAIENLTI